jgi:glycerol-3-phosphate O-acyltransferase
LVLAGDRLRVAPEPFSRPQLEFLADLLRDFVESYLITALALGDLAGQGPMEKKTFVKAVLETGRTEFLAGRISTSESLSRINVENAITSFLDQGALREQDKSLALGPAAQDEAGRSALTARIRVFA